MRACNAAAAVASVSSSRRAHVAQAGQHPEGHWPWIPRQVRVAGEVIMKCRGVGLGDFHLGQQRLEHPRHDVLAAKRKRRRHPVRFA